MSQKPRNCRICRLQNDERTDILRRWLDGASLRELDADLGLPHDSTRHHLAVCEARNIFEVQPDFVATEARRLLDERIAADQAVITSIQVAASKGQNLAVERLVNDYIKRSEPRLALVRYVAEHQRGILDGR